MIKCSSAIEFYTRDSIKFSNYYWQVKESNNKLTGPGFNYFSSDTENIFVDQQGYLHLAVTKRIDKWYSAEVKLMQSLGNGTYIFDLAASDKKLDKNIVNGFFTYDKTDAINYYKEIDIEISNWGKTDSANTQYVVQPYDLPKHLHRFETNLSLPTTHSIEWCKKKISFKSYYLLNDVLVLYNEYSFKPQKKIEGKEEQFSINLWLFKSDAPSDKLKQEVVITRFQFISNKKKK